MPPRLNQRAAGARNAAAAAAAAGAGPVPPIAFSLTPYNLGNTILDYRTPEGRKHYDRATQQLNEIKYDCQSDNLRSFLEDLGRRADAFGWSTPTTGILQIPKDLNDPTQGHYDLLANYGEIDFDHIRQHETNNVGQQTRSAQDSAQLYNCLMNSLSKEATDLITIWKDDYVINGHLSGVLLLRVIIRESYIDTNATATAVREKLSSLDMYMATIDSDIGKFNSYVKQQLATLNARGETTQDLLTNLFKGYLACSDPIFRRYMEKKQESHDEGATIDPNMLMKWAKIKYSIIKEKGVWNAPTKEEQQILAMKAEIKSIKNTKERKRNKNKGKTDEPKDTPKGKPSWMYVEPKESELTKPVTWEGRKYRWCGVKTGGHCEQYRCHMPSKCKGRAKPAHPLDATRTTTTTTPQKPPQKKRVHFEKEKKDRKVLKLTKALANAAVVDRVPIDDDPN